MDKLFDNDSIVRDVALALGAAHLAEMTKDAGSRSLSIQLYDRAVKAASNNVLHPSRARSDGTLVAVRLMALYEVGLLIK